jgi:hypothetical protein
MVTKIETDDQVSVLTKRVRNGLVYCAGLWEKAKECCDDPVKYHEIMTHFDSCVDHLQILITNLMMLDYDGGCVFGQCRYTDDHFVCFGCTKIPPGPPPTQVPLTTEG